MSGARRALAAALAASLAASWTVSASAEPLTEATDRMVRIAPRHDAGPGGSSGVGFFLTPRVIVTARHVLYPDCSPKGRQEGCTDAVGGVLGYDLLGKNGRTLAVTNDVNGHVRDEIGTDLDVALLMLEEDFPGVSGEASVVKVADAMLTGEGAILTLGQPRPTAFQSPSRAFVTDLRDSTASGAPVKRVPLTWPGNPADSGGAIFSNHYGRIVAVYTGRAVEKTTHRQVGTATSLAEPKVLAALEDALQRPVRRPPELDPRYPLSWRFSAVVRGSGGVTERPLDAAPFALDRDHSWTFGFWFGGAASWAPHRNRLFTPDNAIEVGHDSGTLGAVGGELALQLRGLRLRSCTWALLPGANLQRAFYETPAGVEADTLMGSFFLAQRVVIGPLERTRLAVELRPSVEHSPRTRYRLTGRGGEVTPVDPSWGLALALGGGLEF